LGVRGEYFKDETGVALAPDQDVFDVTLSGSYTSNGLTIIPEFRLDALSYDGFQLSDDELDVKSSLSSFVLGVVYAFGD